MQLIDGNALSQTLKDELKAETALLTAVGHRAPCLVAVLVGNDGASETYVAHKIKACEYVGYESRLIRHEADMTEEALLALIDDLNADVTVDGFIVQLPLPKHIDERRVLDAIDPRKDVDGFHPVNFGNMTLGNPALLPATPAGVIEMLDRYNIETVGKHCVVVGRSRIVGRPLSILLSRGGKTGEATVTLCHSRTPKEMLKNLTLQADILVAAVGRPGTITADMVREGAVVIDVGTTRVADPTSKRGWRLRGDVDFEATAPKTSFITPVPGGVGPMTVAMLLKNTLIAYKWHLQREN